MFVVLLRVYTILLHYLNNNFADHKTAGRPVCSWLSGVLLSVACEVDWTAGAACGAIAQSEATRSKGTLQLLLDPTSFSVTTTNTSRYVLMHCSSKHISHLLTVNDIKLSFTPF